MLTKILLTATVIIACLWVLSARRGKPEAVAKVVVSKKDQQKQKLLRQGAWSFMLLMVIAAAIMILVDFWDSNTVVMVHVVNTQTGERIIYQARREDVQSSSFTTVEGRQVFTAGIERIEIEAPQ